MEKEEKIFWHHNTFRKHVSEHDYTSPEWIVNEINFLEEREKEGWELCSVVNYNQKREGHIEGDLIHITYYFKCEMINAPDYDEMAEE